MTESSATPSPKWRYGIHPGAAGLRIRAIGRVDLPVGEALRIEMVDPEPTGDDVVHVQYYIATEYGGWALWASCATGDLAGLDATVHTTTPQPTAKP